MKVLEWQSDLRKTTNAVAVGVAVAVAVGVGVGVVVGVAVGVAVAVVVVVAVGVAVGVLVGRCRANNWPLDHNLGANHFIKLRNP